MSKEKYNDAIVEEVRRVRGGHINGHIVVQNIGLHV